MATTITKIENGLRIRADGYSEAYGAYVQGAFVCDVTVTETAARWHLVDEHGNGDMHGLINALRARATCSAKERREMFPELRGCIVREIRQIQ